MNTKIIVPVIFSTLLLCGSAHAAKGPKEPKIDDVNVVNVPDVNVVNTPDVNVVNVPNVNVMNVPDVNVINFPEGSSDVNVVNTPDVNVVGGVEITNSDPIPVTIENGGAGAQTAIEWRFIGFTYTFTAGSVLYEGDGESNTGHAGMNAACVFEVSQNSRACRASEINGSIMPTGGPVVSGWVIPHKKEVIHNGIEYVAYSPFGLGSYVNEDLFTAQHGLGCRGYTNSGQTYIGTLATRSYVYGSLCNSTIPIACCAPVAVPVQ